MTNTADAIWNRAAMQSGGASPGPGDRALASLLQFHSRAMSSGVLDAVETSSTDDLAAAESGYRFFALEAAARIVERTRGVLAQSQLSDEELEELELAAETEYATVIVSDQTIADRFESRLVTEPQLFAPA